MSYSYLELLNEAESAITDFLFKGELDELVNDICKDAEEYDDWMTTFGHCIANNKMLVDRLASIYLRKFEAKIIERLDDEYSGEDERNRQNWIDLKREESQC